MKQRMRHRYHTYLRDSQDKSDLRFILGPAGSLFGCVLGILSSYFKPRRDRERERERKTGEDMSWSFEVCPHFFGVAKFELS